MPLAAAAQDGATGAPPERIDLTVTAQGPPDPAKEEECRRQREAAEISGEIIVCGATPGDNQRLTTREDARDRYAARTAFRDAPATPDVAGAGIFRGPATLGGICVKGVFNCPKPPAVFVDVTALPKAPPGSDADRISRGLAPLGEDESTVVARQVSAQQRAEMGLPEPASSPAPAPNRAESAAPAAPQ